MIDKNTDFFKITDNFAKTANVPSIQILKTTLDFQPKVTIAIPTYKRADLLKETIDSAINQKGYENYDILVVDNDPERGCATEQLMLSYNNQKISYYKNSENIGMAGNFNRLFELAVGDYVVMLHDDDLILSSFLSECMDFVDKELDLGILRPMLEYFSNSLTCIEMNQFEENSKQIKGRKLRGVLKRLYDIDNYAGFALGAPTGCLFNKKAVLKMGGFNADFYPSLDYCFAVLFSCHYKVYILKKGLTLYRWGVNETLNVSTLKSFVIDAYYVRKSIFKKYRLPKYVMNKYLLFLANNDILCSKNFNSSFELNLSELNLKSENKTKLYIISIIVRCYMKIIKIIKYRAI
jgi:glycosyltransferase involved in cell wall biosynthesis